MLDHKATETIKQAVSQLTRDDVEAGAWQTLPLLADLCAEGLHVEFDFRAGRRIGAPVIIAQSVPAIGSSSRYPECLSGLTPRQIQVALCIAQGLSNKQIARDLGISIATVKDHVHAILMKLEIESRGKVAALVHSDRR